LSWFKSSDEKKLLEISKKLAPIIVSESFLNSRNVLELFEYDISKPEADSNYISLSIFTVTLHLYLANIVALNILKQNKEYFFNNLVNETYEYLKSVLEYKYGKYEDEKSFKNDFYDLINKRREAYSGLALYDLSYLQNETVFGIFSEEVLEYLEMDYNLFNIMSISEIVISSISVIGVKKLLSDI
jgi:hypothetical protein